MDIRIEKLPQARVRCSVAIPTEEQIRAEEKALVKLGSKIKLKGFRPGKAPLDIVREHVEEQELARETVHELLPDLLRRAMQDHKLQPLLPPQVSIAEGSPLKIELLFVEEPEVKLPQDERLKVKRTQPKPLEPKEVDRFIQRMFESDVSETRRTEPAEAGDLVRLDLTVTDEGGKRIDLLSQSPLRAILSEDDVPLPGLAKELTGMQAGQEKVFEMKLPTDFELLELRGKKIRAQVKVHSVSTVTFPILTTAFLTEKLKTQTTPEQFRTDVEKMLSERREDSARRASEQEFFDRVQSQTQVDIAPELIEAELQDMVSSLHERLKQSGQTMEQWLTAISKDATQAVSEMRTAAKDRITLRFGLKELIKRSAIEIPASEMKEAAQQYRASHRSHGHEIPESELEPGRPQYEQMKWQRQVEKLIERYLQ